MPPSLLTPLQYLSSLDVDGNGLLTYSELMTSLHAVTPKTSSKTAGMYAQGFAQQQQRPQGYSSSGGSGYPAPGGVTSSGGRPASSGGRPISSGGRPPYSRIWDLDEHYDAVR